LSTFRRVLFLAGLLCGCRPLSAQNIPGYGWSSFGVLPLRGVDYRIFKTPTRYIIYYIKNGFPTPNTANGAHGRAFSTDL